MPTIRTEQSRAEQSNEDNPGLRHVGPSLD